MQCVVKGCEHTTESIGVTLHKIPEEPESQAAWLRALGLQPTVADDPALVCSQHFRQEDLERHLYLQVRPRRGVMPHIETPPPPPAPQSPSSSDRDINMSYLSIKPSPPQGILRTALEFGSQRVISAGYFEKAYGRTSARQAPDTHEGSTSADNEPRVWRPRGRPTYRKQR